jgi:hypothetical protein
MLDCNAEAEAFPFFLKKNVKLGNLERKNFPWFLPELNNWMWTSYTRHRHVVKQLNSIVIWLVNLVENLGFKREKSTNLGPSDDLVGSVSLLRKSWWAVVLVFDLLARFTPLLSSHSSPRVKKLHAFDPHYAIINMWHYELLPGSSQYQSDCLLLSPYNPPCPFVSHIIVHRANFEYCGPWQDHVLSQQLKYSQSLSSLYFYPHWLCWSTHVVVLPYLSYSAQLWVTPF